MSRINRIDKLGEYARGNIMSAIGISFFAIFCIAGICIAWFFFNDGIKRRNGTNYVYELIRCEKLPNSEQEAAIAENFHNYRYPIYKALWGLKLLGIVRNRNDIYGQIDTIKNIVGIKGIAKHIKQLLKIELAHLLTEVSENKDTILKITHHIKENDTMWPLASEVTLNILLEQGKLQEYKSLATSVLKTAPKNTSERISSILHILESDSRMLTEIKEI